MLAFETKIPSIQKHLRENKVNGWLIYDFRRNNDLGCDFLEIPHEQLLTRRFFYWIPQRGKPVKIVSMVEPKTLDHLPGNTLVYHSWQELEKYVKSLVAHKKIIMEYSPKNAVPAVSKVDAGTMDLVRSFETEVESSADIMQYYTSVWSEEQLKLHLEAAKVLEETVDKTWKMISDVLKQSKKVTEYDIQQFMIEYMHIKDCILEGNPICAVNENSADPHYSPQSNSAKTIFPGDFILIDLWCKKREPKAVFADISRMGYAGKTPKDKHKEVFGVVRDAQKQATEFVQKQLVAGKTLMGCEVDKVSRDVIKNAGYGQYFVHRTGHNIDIKDHGNGTHIDSLETQDVRHLIPGTCFSIEPGIYIPNEFGVRLEYDVYIKPNKTILITGGVQDSIHCLY